MNPNVSHKDDFTKSLRDLITANGIGCIETAWAEADLTALSFKGIQSPKKCAWVSTYDHHIHGISIDLEQCDLEDQSPTKVKIVLVLNINEVIPILSEWFSKIHTHVR